MTKKNHDKKTQKRRRFTIRKAAPDDPIYTRGWVVGGVYPRPAAQRTPPGKKGRSTAAPIPADDTSKSGDTREKKVTEPGTKDTSK